MSVVDNLTQQILAQGTTGQWTGEGAGSKEANAREMAKVLDSAGITDIKDFGQFKEKTYADVPVQQEMVNMGNDMVAPTGRYFYIGENGNVYIDPEKISQQQYYDPEVGYTVGYVAKNIQTGERNVYGNKNTKQAISSNYKRAGGQIFSGTYAGKDSTGFGVQFGPDGTPYFYTQQGASTSSMGDILPVLQIALIAFPGIGGAVGSFLTQTTATTLASQVVGSAIVQGVISEAQGGDFLDGAIKGAVSAGVSLGVAPAVANTVGQSVANVMADSAVKDVITNAVASSASSAVTAALTGGDVESAALTGALAGAGGSVGRELGIASEYGTTPFSEQTQALAAQEAGLGGAGNIGSSLGQAAGAIASGVDSTQAILNALGRAREEEKAATPTSGSSGVVEQERADLLAPVTVPGAENLGYIMSGPGTDVAGPFRVTAQMPHILETAPADFPIPDGYRILSGSEMFGSMNEMIAAGVDVRLADRTETGQSAFIVPASTGKITFEDGQVYIAPTTPLETVGSAQVALPEEPAFVQDIDTETFIFGPPETEITTAPPPETDQITDTGAMDGVAGTIPEITPPSTQEIPIPDQISQELGGVLEGIYTAIPPQDRQVIDLITQPPGITIPGAQEGGAATIREGLARPATIPEGLARPATIPEGLARPNVIREGLAPPDVIPELAPPDMGVQLEPPDTGVQEGIVETIPEVPPEDINDIPEEPLPPEPLPPEPLPPEPLPPEPLPPEPLPPEPPLPPEIDTGLQEGIVETIPEITEQEPTPYIRDTYITGGRRKRNTFGPTVTTLGQALAAPMFPSAPVSGLTSYRGAGEIEGQKTGKPRKNVWNEASLRLKDALGL